MSSSAQPSPAATPASSSLSAPASATGAASSSSPTAVPRVTSRRLGDLVNSIQPNTKLEPELEALLLELADDFVDSVVSMSALLARQRHSAKLELSDVQHHLSRAWGIAVPGYTPMDDWRDAAAGGAIREQQAGDEDGDEERGGKARGRDFSGGVAALQRLKAFRKAAVSEGHKRRMHLVGQAKAAVASGRQADAELNGASETKKRKRSSSGGGTGGGASGGGGEE